MTYWTYAVSIGVAAEIVVGGKSWYMMVVKMTDGVETVGGGWKFIVGVIDGSLG